MRGKCAGGGVSWWDLVMRNQSGSIFGRYGIFFLEKRFCKKCGIGTRKKIKAFCWGWSLLTCQAILIVNEDNVGTAKTLKLTLATELVIFMICECQLMLSDCNSINSFENCAEDLELESYLERFVINCWNSGEFTTPNWWFDVLLLLGDTFNGHSS